jgi:hypothetical protein
MYVRSNKTKHNCTRVLNLKSLIRFINTVGILYIMQWFKSSRRLPHYASNPNDLSKIMFRIAVCNVEILS